MTVPPPAGAGTPPPGVPATYPYPRVPVTRLLDDAARDFPEAPAIEVGRHRLTYRELLDQVDRFAAALRDLGVRPGDRVGTLLPNCPQFVITLFAALRAGATVAAIDPGAVDLRAAINEARCRLLVCLRPSYRRLARLKGRLPTVLTIVATGPEDYLAFPRNLVSSLPGVRRPTVRIPHREGVIRFKPLIRRTAAAPPVVGPPAGSEPAVIAGRYAFDQSTLVAGAFQLRLWVPDVEAGRERVVSAVPPHEPFGLGVLLGLGVLAGSALLFPPADRLQGRRAARARPTILAAPAGDFSRLAGDAPAYGTLRVGLAGEPVEAGAARAFHDATGARVRGGFATDAAVGLVNANPVYGRAKPGSVGLPLSDTATVVLDPAGQPLPTGQVGTVAVRGPQLAPGVPSRGPWTVTDRRGHLDGDGYLWLEARA